MAIGEGNVRYYYFWVCSNFRRFNFRHAVAVRKLNGARLSREAIPLQSGVNKGSRTNLCSFLIKHQHQSCGLIIYLLVFTTNDNHVTFAVIIITTCISSESHDHFFNTSFSFFHVIVLM